jgi:hypothetical protein
MARWWVSWGKDVESPTQGELRIFASAHYLLGELGLSIRQLEAALALGGPADAEIERELEARRLEKRLGERLGRRPDRSGEPR